MSSTRRYKMASPSPVGSPALTDVCMWDPVLAMPLYLLVEDIGRAPEDMEVMKLVKRPSAPGEDIMRGEAGVGIRNMVKQEHCMLNGHGPQSWVSSVGPVDGGMEHHGAGNGHDGADSTLSPGIVVMGSNAGKPDDLVKLV